MIEWIIAILVVGLAYPVGKILTHMTRDELKDGKKWFRLIIIISLTSIVLVFLFVVDYYLKLSVILSLIFMIIVTAVSYIKI